MSERAQILIVDDEEQMLLAMEAVLQGLGHQVTKARDGKEALAIIERSRPELVISDMRMPEMTGLELLKNIHQKEPQLPVVMITAYGTISQAVEAMHAGAFDFITKPFSAEDLERVTSRVLRPTVKRQPKAAPPANQVAIITSDPQFMKLIEIATTIAQSSASVLVQGESGTGKELIARLIHQASGRAQGPFVAVNCAALPGNLLESELFGHEKGAFTGAVAAKVGKFELANGGTILLDEISEMEPVLQAKLLRVLQEREVDRVGGSKPVPIDVRVVATTNRDIRQSVAKGDFREDLFYRLNVVPLYMPPLRERKGDIKLLIEHFIRRFSQKNPKKVTPELIQALSGYSWPGNIRELQNACERAVLLAGNGQLCPEHFLLGAMTQGEVGSTDSELTLAAGMSVSEAERKLIFETLRSTNNNKTKAAELLGISIRTLRNKLHEYGVMGEELEGV
jgi:two-component system response regulator FlrC